MKVTSVSGVKVYDLSQGAKSIPEFLTTKARRRLSKDPEYARRVELLQDFAFPAYSRTVRVSRDGRYILASGGYKPHIKMFDVAEVSLKFERFVDADIIRADILSDDFQKLSILCEDRTLQFHSKFGIHHSVRLPFMGRDVSLDRETCDMYIATNRRSILRFNLMEGRFRQSWETSQSEEHGDEGNNAVLWNKAHRLTAAAGQDGCVRIWDPRQRTECGLLQSAASTEGAACTALQFDVTNEASLSFVVGDSKGVCRVFDLRSSRSVLEKEHPYSTSIKSIQFKRGSSNSSPIVVTNDSRQVKGWDMVTGETLFNIESKFTMDEITIAPLNKLDGDSSGLIFATGQAERVGTFFVPSLGPAPIWASFLESLTEEMEEKDFSVYEDYRFVTKEELEDLSLSGLIGTNQLRPWMHGYFVEARTFEKFKAAVAKPMDKTELRKLKQEEQKKKKAQHIVLSEKIKVKVNPELAERNENIARDDRFASLFQDPEFQVDMESKDFKHMFPAGMKPGDKRKRTRDDDSDNDDEDNGSRVTSEHSKVAVTAKTKHAKTGVPTASTRQVPTKRILPGTVRSAKPGKSSFLDDDPDAMENVTSDGDTMLNEEHIVRTKTPMHKRLLSTKQRESDSILARTEDRFKGEMSITFVPKADLKKRGQQKRGNNRDEHGDDD